MLFVLLGQYNFKKSLGYCELAVLDFVKNPVVAVRFSPGERKKLELLFQGKPLTQTVAPKQNSSRAGAAYLVRCP